MITAPLPRASPSGTGRLSMIIPQNHGLTITYNIMDTSVDHFTPLALRVRGDKYLHLTVIDTQMTVL